MKFLTSFSQGHCEQQLHRLYLLKDASPGGQCGWKSSQCSDPKSCTLTGAAAWQEAAPPSNLCTQTRHHFLRKALNALGSPRLISHPLLLVISSSANMGHKTDYTGPLTTLHACLAPMYWTATASRQMRGGRFLVTSRALTRIGSASKWNTL